MGRNLENPALDGSLWTPEGVTTFTVGGIPVGTNLGTSPTSIQGTLLDMLFAYVAPSVTLTAPTTTTYEFGNNQTPVSLSATTVKHSDNITSVIFQRSTNGGAFSTVSTVGSPNPNGGVETGSNSPSFPLTQVNQVSTLAYRSTVGDGTSTANSNTRTQTYVYPFYYGVGAQSLTGAQIAALTKLVVGVGDQTLSFSPSSQVYYFAYPASYANLTRILDQNGFDITADFTLRNPVSITGLDATAQNYKVYEFNNPTTQTNFNLTFDF